MALNFNKTAEKGMNMPKIKPKKQSKPSKLLQKLMPKGRTFVFSSSY
jgi:hypothetical protein